MRRADIVLFILLALSSCTSDRGLQNTIYEGLYSVEPSFGHTMYVRQASRDSAWVYLQLDGDDLISTGDERFPVSLELEVKGLAGSGRRDTLFMTLDPQDLISRQSFLHARTSIALKDTLDLELVGRLGTGQERGARTILSFKDAMEGRYRDIKVNDIPKAHCACSKGDQVSVQIYGWQSGKVEMITADVEQDLPPPPFSINGTPEPEFIEYDSQMMAYDGELSFPCPGDDALIIRHIDSGAELILPVFGPDYPQVMDYEMMKSPLRYLTNSSEYEDLLFAEDSRKAIEDFWLSCDEDKERAKRLMSSYYGRVHEANTHFTEVVEGWRTDRGLVYVVYGPPQRVLRTARQEIWYYGAEGSMESFQLGFYHNGQAFLDRSLDYRPSWYLTVDSWRSGRTLTP